MRQLGTDGNIEIGLREIGCEAVEWIHLAQDCVQWCCLEFLIFVKLIEIKKGGYDISRLSMVNKSSKPIIIVNRL